MIDETQGIEILKKRVEYFFKNQIPIHISLKTERWLNGIILEVSDEFFILKEFKEGEKPIFYIEILPNGIEPFTEGEKKKNEV